MANSVNATMNTVKNLTINSVQVICVEKLIFDMLSSLFKKIMS